MASILLFFSFLIDYARIAIIEKTAESAVRSSVHSVLSAYDKRLFEQYGLFGRGGTDEEELFRNVFDQYERMQNEQGRGLRLLDMKLEEARLANYEQLGMHPVIGRQILEQMKYQAPIDFSIEIVGKLAPLARSMQESSATVQTMRELKKWYEQREEALDKALNKQFEAGRSAHQHYAKWQNEVLLIINGASRYYTLLDEIAQHAIEMSRSETDLLQLSGEEHAAAQASLEQQKQEQANRYIEAASYENKVKQTASKIEKELDESGKLHHEAIHEVVHQWETAKGINDQMRSYIEQNNNKKASHYQVDAALEFADNDRHSILTDQQQRELEEIGQNSDKLIRSEDFFEIYNNEIEQQELEWERVEYEGNELVKKLHKIIDITGKQRIEASKAADKLRISFDRLYAGYKTNYLEPATVLETRRATNSELHVRKQLKKQDEEVKQKWTQLQQILKVLKGAKVSEQEKENYKQLKQYVKDNLDFNIEMEPDNLQSESIQQQNSTDAEEGAGEAANASDTLFLSLSQFLLKARDRFYFGEFTLARFSSFPPQQLTALLKGETEQEKDIEVFKLAEQEAEFILYGFYHPSANIAAAYTEMTALRMAIRLMEGLIEKKGLGHPLLIFSAALAYAIDKTTEDLLAIANKGEAPLSKFAPVPVRYKDYLRIFLLMHGGSERDRLARIVAVIEWNTGLLLSAIATGVVAETNISANLWFLPGVIKAVGRTGILRGKVKGNRYETIQSIGWSYS